MPTADKIKELATELNTTADYLLGETDTPAPLSRTALIRP